MRNLYIIGNGFDSYHGLDTKYWSFAKYLNQIDKEVYELVLKYYGLPDISKNYEYDAWAKFELSMADLDFEQVLDDYSDSIANLGGEDFRDSDWHTYQIDMERIVEKLTKRLISIFNDFIVNVQYPDNIEDSKLKLLSPSIFLSFNYTDTLQRYYNISIKDICYIHDKSSKEECKIILGHGTDPSKFEVKGFESKKSRMKMS